MIDFFGRKFRKNIIWYSEANSDDPRYAVDWAKSTGVETELCMDASLVMSLTDREVATFEFDSEKNQVTFTGPPAHAPVIDLDVAHHYEPSTTPGHGHLYLNKDMRFEDMMEILNVLVKHGIVQPGYRDAAGIRGWAAVRTPWTPKSLT